MERRKRKNTKPEKKYWRGGGEGKEGGITAQSIYTKPTRQSCQSKMKKNKQTPEPTKWWHH